MGRHHEWHIKCPYCGKSLIIIGPELTTHHEGDQMILTATAQIEKHQCAEKDAAEAALKTLVEQSLKELEDRTFGTQTQAS